MLLPEFQKNGIKLTNAAVECEDCKISKTRRADVLKKQVERSKIPGERLHIDISSIEDRSIAGLLA